MVPASEGRGPRLKEELECFGGRKVLVTGGAGLIGSAFVELLREAGARVSTVRHRRPLPDATGVRIIDGDLREARSCREAVAGAEYVVHAAGISGGSKRVTVDAIEMFTDSLLMNTQMLEAARRAAVRGYLFVSNSSVYPASGEPLREELAWGESSAGTPENETGTVKRAGETQCALYAKFTDLRLAIMRAGNAYGPRDNFDLEASHVVPALIRKAVEGQQPFRVWGSGQTVRDFIHTRDLARGGLFLLQRARAGHCFPVNIATGRTVTIEQLARIILRLAGRPEARIELDPAAPPASPAKLIDVGRMRRLGFSAELSLEEGLRQTIGWYRAQAAGAAGRR
jgi:GDP-L-fucose synthase